MKRAQIALEFLVTYGWGIVIMVSVISALFFLGIQNPEQYVSDQCIFEDAFICEEFGFTPGSGPNGYISIRITNTVGLPIAIQDVSTIVDGTTDCDFSESFSPPDINPISPTNPLIMNSSNTTVIETVCSAGTALNQDSAVAIDYTITYQVLRPGYFQKEVTAKITGQT